MQCKKIQQQNTKHNLLTPKFSTYLNLIPYKNLATTKLRTSKMIRPVFATALFISSTTQSRLQKSMLELENCWNLFWNSSQVHPVTGQISDSFSLTKTWTRQEGVVEPHLQRKDLEFRKKVQLQARISTQDVIRAQDSGSAL